MNEGNFSPIDLLVQLAKELQKFREVLSIQDRDVFDKMVASMQNYFFSVEQVNQYSLLEILLFSISLEQEKNMNEIETETVLLKEMLKKMQDFILVDQNTTNIHYIEVDYEKKI